MYKALICDLDGTVTAVGADGSDITEQTRQAVKKALSLGKKLTCATGRGWASSIPIVKHLGFTDPCIIEGGSCIIDPRTEKILWEMTLSPSESKAILEIFREVAVDQGSIKSTLITERITLKEIQAINGPNRVIYLMGLDAEVAEKVKDAVNQTNFAVAHNTSPSWYGPEFTDVHVTNPEGTKEHAIDEWLKMMNVSEEQTIGLGDSENDLPLFQSVGLKVVVANAQDNVKQKADKVVAAYDRGGLEQTINELLMSD